MPRVFDDTQPNLRDIVKEAIADGSVLPFGQRPGSLGVSKVAEQGCPRAGIAIQFRVRNRREVSLSRILLCPVFGRRRDAPNISRLVERQSEEPKLFVLSHRDAIHHARADAPDCWKPLQEHRRPNCQRLTEADCAPLGVYQNHQACVGKRFRRIRADESNWNLARNSSAPSAPSFLFVRTHI